MIRIPIDVGVDLPFIRGKVGQRSSMTLSSMHGALLRLLCEKPLWTDPGSITVYFLSNSYGVASTPLFIEGLEATLSLAAQSTYTFLQRPLGAVA